MADLIFVAVTVAFFAICVLYVRACDRIIGPDETVPAANEDGAVVDLTEAGEAAR
jgi:hypothetical protein